MIIWSVLGLILLATIALLLFWKFVFLRNPTRNIPDETNIIVSPADGKIIKILNFEKDAIQLYKGDKRYRGIINTLTNDVATAGHVVSIFMSPLDVHYNRAPMSGTVQSVQHQKGKFLPVQTFEAGLENEKSEIVISNKHVTIKMIQIAGFLARRINTYVRPGDTVDTGQLVGLINLGSQVTLILPKSIELNIKQGDRVVAGETILAKINL